MALKIEWVLISIIIGFLGFAYDFKVHTKTSQEHNGISKNLEFYDISFSKVDTDTILSVVDITYGVLYNSVLNAYNIRYHDKHIDKIFAQKAIFVENYLYLEDNVSVYKTDNFSCVTQSAIYDKNLSIISTSSWFEAKLDNSTFKGKHLIYNIDTKVLKASNIKALLEL